jgi:hypothetical protein
MPKKRPILTKDISPQDKRQTFQAFKKGASHRGNINAWLSVKKQQHIEAGLYRKTINHKTYIYKPLGDHLWERTSEDGKNRTLVKHLPDDLD